MKVRLSQRNLTGTKMNAYHEDGTLYAEGHLILERAPEELIPGVTYNYEVRFVFTAPIEQSP